MEFDFPKAFKIGFAISIVTGLINMVLGLVHPVLGFVGIAVGFVVAMFAINKMAGVTMGRSAALAGIILVVQILLVIGLAVVVAALFVGAAAVSGGAGH